MVGVASRGIPTGISTNSGAISVAGGALRASVRGIAGAAVDALISRASAVEIEQASISLAEVPGPVVGASHLSGFEHSARTEGKEVVDLRVRQLELAVGVRGLCLVGAVLAAVILRCDDLGPADPIGEHAVYVEDAEAAEIDGEAPVGGDT